MSDILKVTLVQTDICWMDIQSNLNDIETQLQHLKTDLIVLPEMFATGFCMEAAKIATPMDGVVVMWMLEIAQQLNCAICGSLSMVENHQHYNRFLFVTPQGVQAQYDKKHLFTYGKESEVYIAGQKATTICYKGWKIRPFICYDLRFPVWNRNTDGYDIALYVANWPAKRAFAWNSLLTARAIENVSYVLAVNRLGADGNNLYYQGDSKALSPLGDVIADCKNVATVRQLNLFKDLLQKTRNQYGFLQDMDSFKIC